MVIFLYNLYIFVWLHDGCLANMVFTLDPSNNVTERLWCLLELHLWGISNKYLWEICWKIWQNKIHPKLWLGKLTKLNMTPLGWLGHKTSTQTNTNKISRYELVHLATGIMSETLLGNGKHCWPQSNCSGAVWSGSTLFIQSRNDCPNM